MKHILLFLLLLFPTIVTFAQTSESEIYDTKPDKLPQTVEEIIFLRKLVTSGHAIACSHLFAEQSDEYFRKKEATSLSSEKVRYRTEIAVTDHLCYIMRTFNARSKSAILNLSKEQLPGFRISETDSAKAIVVLFTETREGDQETYIKSLIFYLDFTDVEFQEAKNKLKLEAKK